MDGALWFRTPRTILPPRTTLSAPVIGSISRRLPGLGRTRCIGANPSGVGRFKFDKRKSLKMRVGKFQALPKLARPVAEKATGLFLVFRGFGPGYLRVVAERAPCRSTGKRNGAVFVRPRGTAQAADSTNPQIVSAKLANARTYYGLGFKV